MKQTVKMSRAVGQLEKMYNVINTEKFSGDLPVPIITVQSKPGTWGHCTTAKIWKSNKDGAERYEMNIAAECLSGPIEEIVDTLIHEMIHLYCRENGIKEVSRGGKYHNKTFKKLAEEKGLVTVEAGQYGWNTQGTNNDNLIAYCLEHDWTEIYICRGGAKMALTGTPGTTAGNGIQPQGVKGPKAPSSTRKYMCPKCGNSFRATKDLRVMCMDCNVQFEKV